MTKHNLEDHLGWLVKSKPTFPSYLASAGAETYVEAPSVSETVNTFQPRSANPPSASALLTKESGDGNHQSEASKIGFLRPTTPASFLNGGSRDAMARLQSGPKTNNKPRLLSEQLSTSVQPSLPSMRAPGISLKDKYEARCSSLSDGNCLTSRLAFLSDFLIQVQLLVPSCRVVSRAVRPEHQPIATTLPLTSPLPSMLLETLITLPPLAQ